MTLVPLSAVVVTNADYALRLSQDPAYRLFFYFNDGYPAAGTSRPDLWLVVRVEQLGHDLALTVATRDSEQQYRFDSVPDHKGDLSWYGLGFLYAVKVS